MEKLHEYAFGCTLTASLRLRATSREQAEAQVRLLMDSENCTGGLWPNGDPVGFEASANDDPLVLYEVDGKQVHDSAFDQTHVGKLIRRIFASIVPEEVDNVINRVMGVHPEADAAGEQFEYQMRGVGCIEDNAIVNPEFCGDSDHTVGSVQKLLSAALAANGVEKWAAGTARMAQGAVALCTINGQLVAVSNQGVGSSGSKWSEGGQYLTGIDGPYKLMNSAQALNCLEVYNRDSTTRYGSLPNDLTLQQLNCVLELHAAGVEYGRLMGAREKQAEIKRVLSVSQV